MRIVPSKHGPAGLPAQPLMTRTPHELARSSADGIFRRSTDAIMTERRRGDGFSRGFLQLLLVDAQPIILGGRSRTVIRKRLRCA